MRHLDEPVPVPCAEEWNAGDGGRAARGQRRPEDRGGLGDSHEFDREVHVEAVTRSWEVGKLGS